MKNQFQELTSNQYSSLILQQFEDIDSIFQRLNPTQRQKRWDKVGTIWKFIAGTPDANDLRLINSSINNLVSNNNQQVKINREITLQLKDIAFKTKEAIQLFNSRSLEFHSINILENLKYLYQKLEQILETITLAKLGILNIIILSDKEINLFIKDLAREQIIVSTTAEAISYATTSIASNRKEIALLIKLPKLNTRIYRKVHVHPIIHNHQQIHLSDRNYIFHGNETYIVESLKPTIFKLTEVRLGSSTCVPKLLEGQPAICNYTSNPTPEEIISIDDQHLLINTAQNFTIKTDCGVSERNLSGSYLVSYENCSVNISNIMFRNTIQHLSGNPIRLSLDGVEITKDRKVLNLSLEHLHYLQTETRKDLESIRLENDSLQWTPWSIFGTFTFTPTIIGLAILFCFFARRHAMKIQLNQQVKEIPTNHDTTLDTTPVNLEELRTEPRF